MTIGDCSRVSVSNGNRCCGIHPRPHRPGVNTSVLVSGEDVRTRDTPKKRGISPGSRDTSPDMTPFESAVRTIQFLSADAVEQANSGHPGTPMALAGIATEIFSNHLRHNPEDPSWPNRDRFVLSCGHASMLVYSVLHLAGYKVSKEDIKAFRQLDSVTPGHPEFGHTQGVETTTGPLGQGVGNAVGLALGSKLLGQRLNSADGDVFNYRVFAIASDGDLMEGVASEAASLAGHLGLGNLVIVYDANNITIDGKADASFSEDVGKRFEAYGWGVWHVDGHDPAEVNKALDSAVGDAAKPSLIVARTHIGIGCPTKQDTSKAHGAPLGREEIDAAKKAADWPLEPFFVPDNAGKVFADRVSAVKPEYNAWQALKGELDEDRAALYTALLEDQAPEDLLQKLIDGVEAKKEATRASGSRVLQEVGKLVPSLISGSADLSASTKTDLNGVAHIQAGDFAGRNVHYGIREHGMASIANGLSLSGLIPVTSTFLIFSDYMRPPIRLASMMNQGPVYVFTHDSFFVGEDGPTHQPIEQLGALRLIPGLDVWRPADTAECAAAWTSAIEHRDSPTALALTRQGLPVLERASDFDNASMLVGAYVLADAKDPTLVLLASGSEVHVAIGAKALLEAKGQRVRVVSVPCLEAFQRQTVEVQKAVLGDARRVSLEAGGTAIWKGIVGLDGIAIGIDHFGASAPAAELQQRFGFTPEAVTERVLASL